MPCWLVTGVIVGICHSGTNLAQINSSRVWEKRERERKDRSIAGIGKDIYVMSDCTQRLCWYRGRDRPSVYMAVGIMARVHNLADRLKPQNSGDA
jgi:hypothetical protein